MSGKTSETRCAKCYFLACPCAGRGVCGCVCHSEPTPPEGEADPLSPLLDMSVVEGLSEELRKAKAEGEAVPEQPKCEDACDAKNGIHTAMCHLRRNPPGPVVSTPDMTAAEHLKQCCACNHGRTPCIEYQRNWPVVSTAAPGPPKCVLLRCTCGQVSYVTEAELIGMDRGTVYSCPKCGLALTSANKTNKARSTVAPESYKPAEGAQIKVQRYDPIAEIQEIADNLAKSGDCIGSLKLEAAINILRPAATPVTVEAPETPCNFCGFSLTIPHPKCVKSRRHASSYKKVEVATPKRIGDVEAPKWDEIEALAVARQIYLETEGFTPLGKQNFQCTKADQVEIDKIKAILIGNTLTEATIRPIPQPPCSECATLRKERDEYQGRIDEAWGKVNSLDRQKAHLLEVYARISKEKEAAEAQLSTLREALKKSESDLTEAKKDAQDWKREFEMYRDAWIRELGGWLFPKHHLIDALVLTTRARCVNPILGNCSAPHRLGKPTEDRKALQQISHPQDVNCKGWAALAPTPEVAPKE